MVHDQIVLGFIRRWSHPLPLCGCFRSHSERLDSIRARDSRRSLIIVPRARTRRFRRNHSHLDHKAFVQPNLSLRPLTPASFLQSQSPVLPAYCWHLPDEPNRARNAVPSRRPPSDKQQSTCRSPPLSDHGGNLRNCRTYIPQRRPSTLAVSDGTLRRYPSAHPTASAFCATFSILSTS